MITRLLSGQRHLDAVLGGGLPDHSIVLVSGPPGTGKTMMAQQYLFHAATEDRPGLYLTTASEPLDKVVHFAQELAFFDREAVGTRVIYESVSDILATHGLVGLMDRLVELLRDLRPGLVVLDSLGAVEPHAASTGERRRFIAELAGRFSALPVTAFWLSEQPRSGLLATPEAAAADVIISLGSEDVEQRSSRHLQVLKVRGSRFLPGRHGYRLSDKGLEVFPRFADTLDISAPSADGQRLSLGSSGIDELLAGGVFAGSTTLVIGPSGVGKTMLGLDFLAAGTRARQRGIFATLQENPRQLAQILAEPGRASFDGLVAVHRRSPVDINIDEWVHEVLDLAGATGARRLLVDSLSDLRLAAHDPKGFDEYVYSLAQRCSRLGVTCVMTLESQRFFAVGEPAGSTLSHLADNVVLLTYVRDASLVRRVIHVLKSRGSRHDQAIREFSIDATGLSIGEPLSPENGDPTGF